MLLLDGHSSHYSPATIKLAAENQILVFVLPPNTTQIAHPLDVGCFSPLKAAWRKYCHDFRAKNTGRVVTRYDFCQIFSRAWYKAMSVANIVSSFKATGVCLFNRHAFDNTVTEGSVNYAAFNPQNLAERMGLAYIPLYSPARKDRKQRSPRTSTPHNSHRIHNLFSDSEINSDSKIRHSSPLPQRSLNDSSFTKNFIPLRRSTTSKFLVQLSNPNKACQVFRVCFNEPGEPCNASTKGMK